MSVPSRDDLGSSHKVSTDVSGFYGRSYPRASFVLDKNNDVQVDRKMPPPTANAPLIGMRPPYFMHLGCLSSFSQGGPAFSES